MTRTTHLMWTLCVIVFVWSQMGYYGQCGTETQMRDLLNATLNSSLYSSRVRPISDTGNSLQVKIDLYLVAINDVDEVEQKMTSTAYLSIEWPDTFITWTPSDYGNINKITIPQYRIWKPDVALSNAYDTITGLGSNFMYVEVDYNGTITWRPYQVFDSSCTVDMTYFPFDEQTCDLLMVTWSSTKDMISLVTGSVGFNTDNYATNANWNLESVSTYDSSTSSTSGLAFSMKLKRKPVFFLINFIIPIFLLSFLNIFVFVLPCDSGEKASYAIVLFLSFAIFLLIVTEMMPEGMTTVPIISTYLMLECIISTLIVFLTIIQLRLHNMGEETAVPRFLKTFVAGIAKLRGKSNNCMCCDCSRKARDEDEDDGKKRLEENDETIVAATDMPEKEKEALGEKRLSLKSNSKFRDLIYGRKVFPNLFSKPVVSTTPYEKDIELQDIEEPAGNGSAQKRSPINHARATTPVIFTNKRRQSLVSEEGFPEKTPEEEVKDDGVEWSDVTGAMDWFFVWLFTIFTIVITLVIVIVLVAA